MTAALNKIFKCSRTAISLESCSSTKQSNQSITEDLGKLMVINTISVSSSSPGGRTHRCCRLSWRRFMITPMHSEYYQVSEIEAYDLKPYISHEN
ncbi:hypothetical protein NQZ68_032600 [Dissostichus eleginoides]|nr:hypothetical protein NQZ68_032600 [Dissostichus eleginoides]